MTVDHSAMSIPVGRRSWFDTPHLHEVGDRSAVEIPRFRFRFDPPYLLRAHHTAMRSASGEPVVNEHLFQR